MARLQRKIGSAEDSELSTLISNRSAAVTATVVARSKRDMKHCQKRFDRAGQAMNVSICPLILSYEFSILMLYVSIHCVITE